MVVRFGVLYFGGVGFYDTFGLGYAAALLIPVHHMHA